VGLEIHSAHFGKEGRKEETSVLLLDSFFTPLRFLNSLTFGFVRGVWCTCFSNRECQSFGFQVLRQVTSQRISNTTLCLPDDSTPD